MKCSQCSKPAILDGLCVDHAFIFQLTLHNKLAWSAQLYNDIASQIEAGSGGISQIPRVKTPPSPSAGSAVTQNVVNISANTISLLNTGTIDNLNTGIVLLEQQGLSPLAHGFKQFTEATDKSIDLTGELKKDIIEHLEILLVYLNADPTNRKRGLIKSVLNGIKELVTTSGSLLALWNGLLPMVQPYLA